MSLREELKTIVREAPITNGVIGVLMKLVDTVMDSVDNSQPEVAKITTDQLADADFDMEAEIRKDFMDKFNKHRVQGLLEHQDKMLCNRREDDDGGFFTDRTPMVGVYTTKKGEDGILKVHLPLARLPNCGMGHKSIVVVFES